MLKSLICRAVLLHRKGTRRGGYQRPEERAVVAGHIPRPGDPAPNGGLRRARRQVRLGWKSIDTGGLGCVPNWGGWRDEEGRRAYRKRRPGSDAGTQAEAPDPSRRRRR